MSTTNIDRATTILRNAGLNDTTVTDLIDTLTAADVIAPDLPEPTEPDENMPTWKIDDETSVSSTPDGCVMVMGGNGMFSMYFDMDEVDAYAMALLAAAKRSKKRNSFLKTIFTQMDGNASDNPFSD